MKVHVLRCLLLATVLTTAGCISAHRVRIETDPPGAEVTFRNKSLGPSPVELTMLWVPGRWWFYNLSSAQVEAPDHREGRARIGKNTWGSVFWDTVLLPLPDEFNGVAPWKWKWGHFNRLFGLDVRHTHEIQLIRRHGRAGTWEPEDAEEP